MKFDFFGDVTLEEAVVRSVRARGDAITDADLGNVELALSYARQIDAIPADAGQDRTKALYLGPHLLNALRALGCTPESRGEAGEDAAPPQEDKLSKLRGRRGGA